MKLHTETYDGNLHQAAVTVNKKGLAEYVIAMDVVGYYTIVVFKMPDELAYKVREESPYYSSDPHHDDVVSNQTIWK